MRVKDVFALDGDARCAEGLISNFDVQGFR